MWGRGSSLGGYRASRRLPERQSTCTIYVFHEDGNAVDNPSMRAILKLLVSEGVDVLYFTRESSPRVDIAHVVVLRRIEWLRKLVAISTNWICSLTLSHGLLAVLWKRRPANCPQLVIGVDRLGLVEGTFVAKRFGVPFIFVSFEMNFRSETGDRFIEVESRAAKGIDLVIVQDADREAALIKELDIRDPSTILLPLGDSGSVNKFSRSNGLRDQMGIPSSARVLVSVGSVAPWTGIREVLAKIDEWPEEWVLLIHHRYGWSKTLEALGGAAGEWLGKRVFLSEARSLSRDELILALAGCDLGLALYTPTPPGVKHSRRYLMGPRTNLVTGLNLAILGRASGKVATYARAGIPIVTNDSGLMAQDLARFEAGFTLDCVDDLPTLLRAINPERNRVGVQRYFQEVLDFDLYRTSIWAHIRSTCSQ